MVSCNCCKPIKYSLLLVLYLHLIEITHTHTPIVDICRNGDFSNLDSVPNCWRPKGPGSSCVVLLMNFIWNIIQYIYLLY